MQSELKALDGRHLVVSARHRRYLALDDGTTFIPNGLNLCFPRFATSHEEAVAKYDRWLRRLAAHRGNFVRLWLGVEFFDIEPDRIGSFDAAACERLARILDLSASLGLRVKLTLEHFRFVEGQDSHLSKIPGAPSFARPQHHPSRGGCAPTIEEFFSSETCRDQFRRKLDLLAERFGEHPALCAIEPWNEINAVRAPSALWLEWVEVMLDEVKRRFPSALALQSLGSFECEADIDLHRRTMTMPGNEIAQAHRYLNLGAELAVCHGPMGELVADAVGRLRGLADDKPVLLAETGAVEPGHAGPWKHYEEDRQGVLMHDALFAAFFAGACGSGQMWHWHFYVDRHDLWYHFDRFAQAVEGFDPIAQQAAPHRVQAGDVAMLALRGRTQTLVWCRDRRSDWKTEIEAGQAPTLRDDVTLPLADLLGRATVTASRVFDPWSGETACSDAGRIDTLPPFRRSLVLRLEHTAAKP